MNINKVTAIFDEFRLKEVAETLIRHGVKGFTLHPVRGRGYYFDSFNENHLIKHINADSEGLVCIVPVNDLIWIHDKRSATDNDFQFHR